MEYVSDLIGEKSLNTLYRDVVIREKITPDGSRRIDSVWQSFHDDSGRELSSENARRLAQGCLRNPPEEPIFGYPDRLILKQVFLQWPELDYLSQWQFLRIQACPNETPPLRSLKDNPLSRQSKRHSLRLFLSRIVSSLFSHTSC